MNRTSPSPRWRRSTLLIVAIAALGGLVWMQFGPQGTRDRSAERETVAEADVTPRRTGPEDAPPESDATGAAAGKRTLRVRVELADGETERVAVTIRAEGRPPVDARVPAGVDSDIEVESLLAAPTPAVLLVQADHPDCLPEEATVTSAEARDGVVGEVVLRLRRAAVVHGRVQGADGTPWPDAAVALFPLRHGLPADEPVAGARTGADGAFRLRAGVEGLHLLVVLEKDRVPASATVELWTGRATEAPPLVLVPGAAITGHVRVNGALPDGQAVVRAAPRAEGHLFWHDNALWADGRVHHAEALGFTEDDGSYRIGGLAPGAHRVWASDVPAAHPDLVGGPTERTVTAPADVDFDLACAWLRIPFPEVDVGTDSRLRHRLTIHGTPPPDGPRFGLALSTVEPETVRVAVVPGAAYRIEYTVGSRRPAAQTVRAPGPGGTLDVELTPGPPRGKAALTVMLRADPNAPPRRVTFALYAPEDRAATAWRYDVEGVGGDFRLEDLPVGRFRVIVHPKTGFCLDGEAEVELQDGATSRVEVTLRRGGTLRVVARGAAGALLEANCDIADAQGRAVAVDFVSSDGRNTGPELLRPGGPNNVRPALPAGRYTLRFAHEGYQPAAREVDIRTGERLDLEVTLQPER